VFNKFFESGYSVIPLAKASKKPILDNWSKYCEEYADEALVDTWDIQFEKGHTNIGLCLGKASNIVALDIDTDNPETLALAPKSPVAKRGAKGETRFFVYSEDIKTDRSNLKTKGYEILSTGTQTVIPPSVHPVTKVPYKWTTTLTLLDVEPDDLPKLYLSDLEILPNLNAKEATSAIASPGRNSTLVQIVSAMRSRGEPEQKIIDEVYSYDKTHHLPRLFMDSSENFDAKNEEQAKNNAWLFVNRVTQSLIKKNIAVLPFELKIDYETKNNVKSYEYKAPPILTGFLSSFASLVVAASKGRVDVIALGGAFSVLSVLASNRFRVGSTWPNLYILNVAKSGVGKGAPQDLAKLLLQGSGLIGSANYRSGASMYSYLPFMQERLDVIDEASMLFRAMKNGDSWQAEMQEILCTLFSCSNSYFAGVTLKGSLTQKTRSINDGACYNPCINILASTTPQGFRESFDLAMSSKGLLPRFLIFNQHEVGEWKEYKGFKALESEVSDLKAFCNDILKFNKRVLVDTTNADTEKGEQNVGRKYDPLDYPLKASAKEHLNSFDRHYFNLAKTSEEEVGAFYARFCELATKLSMLIAISSGKSEIDTDCAVLACEIVEMQHHNARLLLEGLPDHNQSQFGRYVNAVLTRIKKHGRIRRTLVEKNLKSLTKRQCSDLFEKLISSGEIVEEKGERGGSVLLYVGGSDQAQYLK
jgi:hypothetical protein